MVIVRLKGLAKATKRLASGEKRVYWYAWRGGPQLKGKPGSEEFMQSHADAIAKRKAELTTGDDLRSLIREFESSTDYPTGNSSVKSYKTYLGLIEKKFGTLPIKALKEPEVRGVFLRWRDEFKKTPRKADYLWTVLGKLMSFAVNRGVIKTNPCARAGRLAESGARIDITWSDEDLERLFAEAPWEVALVCFAALWTGQRQGDVLSWKRSNIQDGILRFQQGKRQKGKPPKKIAMPVPAPLAEALKRAKKGEALCLNSRGEPWTGDGFRASLARVTEAAGIDGLRFHDMRGTFSSAAGDAGASEPEISAVTGHALPGRSALSSAYLKRSLVMATSCIRLVEEYKAGTVWFTALTNNPGPDAKKKSKPALQTVANQSGKCDSTRKSKTPKKRSDLNDLPSVVGDVGLEPTTR
jgi:integrase